MSERLRVALLLTVALLVYGNTLLNGFTLDDDAYILHNPAVTSPSLKGFFSPTRHNNVFRPVTFASFALNWAIGHGRPFGYHLVNLLLNAVVALLLYVLLRKLLEAVPHGATISWVAALLFAVHPIHTEAVASISGRSELLAATFFLAAWLLHLKERPLLALLCFVLALLSKESAVVFLPLVFVVDYARGKLKPLPRYAWMAGVVAVYLALLWKVQGGRFGEKGISFLDNPLASLPAGWRILNTLRVAWKFLALHVYPATLSCDYSYNAIPFYTDWLHTLPAAFAAAIVLALWIWALRTHRVEWFLAGAIYLLCFSVTANLLIPTGTILGERLAYLPSAGFCLLVALVWIRIHNRNRTLAWVVLAVLIAALAMRTILRNADWRDDLTLFSKDAQSEPESAKLHAMLGGQFMARGQWDAAHHQFDTGLRIYPNFPEVMELRGLVESRLGRDQEACRSLERALSMTQKGSSTYDSIAISLAIQLAKVARADDALNLLNEVIANSPAFSLAWSNRAVLRYQRGDFLSAREDAQTALRLDPFNTQAQYLLKLLAPPH